MFGLGPQPSEGHGEAQVELAAISRPIRDTLGFVWWVQGFSVSCRFMLALIALIVGTAGVSVILLIMLPAVRRMPDPDDFSLGIRTKFFFSFRGSCPGPPWCHVASFSRGFRRD